MELPDDLKVLYKHWNYHVNGGETSTTPNLIFHDLELFENINWFISERLKIWQKKTAGAKPPYTDDPILSRYRFCNIFREFDRQTIEFHTLLNPYRHDFPLWLLNMFYFRMVAKTETVRSVDLLSFDEKESKLFYKKLMESTRPRFGTPYVFPISTIQKSSTPTRELFIANYLPSIMREIAEEISGWKQKSVYDGLQLVIPIFKYNLNFLWTEVLIDVAYQFPEHVNLFGRFPIGPGSLPTLQKINPDKDPTILVQELSGLPIETGLSYDGKSLRLSAENWEGIGCEYRKYTNLKFGKGRKRLYCKH